MIAEAARGAAVLLQARVEHPARNLAADRGNNFLEQANVSGFHRRAGPVVVRRGCSRRRGRTQQGQQEQNTSDKAVHRM
jgi:hypothetical protein